jgi:hypothetical protein
MASGPPEKLKEKGFDLVVGVMSEDEVFYFETFGRLFEKTISEDASRRFGVRGIFRSFSGNKWEVVGLGELLDPSGIGAALFSPTVVKVEDGRFFSDLNQGMKE